jgi:hypothetical protein
VYAGVYGYIKLGLSVELLFGKGMERIASLEGNSDSLKILVRFVIDNRRSFDAVF